MLEERTVLLKPKNVTLSRGRTSSCEVGNKRRALGRKFDFPLHFANSHQKSFEFQRSLEMHSVGCAYILCLETSESGLGDPNYEVCEVM
jgi:hypothetical protein